MNQRSQCVVHAYLVVVSLSFSLWVLSGPSRFTSCEAKPPLIHQGGRRYIWLLLEGSLS